MKFRYALPLAFLCSTSALGENYDGVTGHDDEGNEVYLLNSQELGSLVYNGTRSREGEFPAVGWIGNCTGTLVSRDVIFTAAHCVRNGARISFAHRESGRSYAATCSRHPRVNTRNWFNDYALCKLDKPVPEGSVVASFKQETPNIGQALLLNGLGAPTVRTHQWGRSSVTRLGSQDIVTCGQAVLGGGDSGGSVFEWVDDRSGATEHFYILGVNSRSDRTRCSYFNRINHSEFTSWAKSYEERNNVELCGVSAVCDQPAEPEPCREELSTVGEAYTELENCKCVDAALELANASHSYAQCLSLEQ